ncbi:MAG: DUF6242 domain-containing protein [Muribaculaceae bacterium]
MSRRFPLYLMLGMLVAMLAISCNDDANTDMPEYVVSNNTAVTSFNLNADDNVLANLDSVFFSIDLKNRLIYNADSLPKGTDVTGLTITVGFATYATCKMIQKNSTFRPDSAYDYTTTDTLDFTGDVSLKLIAEDGNEVEYKVKVNVHNMDPDSLYWDRMARRDLPNVTGELLAQRTVQRGSDIFTLVKCDAGCVLSTTPNPGDDSWTKVDAQFGMVPNVNSFAASNDALYLLDENGALYSSSDGEQWSACGVEWTHITGGYNNRVLGLTKQGNTYYYDEYPRRADFASTPIDDGFPVEGNSQLVVYDNSWNVEAQAIMVGGIDANGRYRGDCWGYDGNQWALLRNNVLPSLADVTLVQYVSYEGGGLAEELKEHRTWYAMGGRNLRGDLNDVLYISRHQGLYWSEADTYLQLPDYIGDFCKAQAFVCTSVLTRSAGDSWTAMPSVQLPVWARYTTSPLTRSSKPVTEWDCQYIYIFGGEDVDGNVNNNIWRGTIARMMFKPII